MLDRLIVVDYQEGAGGEFIASWLSAHMGQQLESDLQARPNYLQKWLNSHRLIRKDWQQNFENYLIGFNNECANYGVNELAIPYHLYHYPNHVSILSRLNQARFVRINCDGYETQVYGDFCRKVLNRVLTVRDFAEIKFILQAQSQEKIQYCLDLFKKNQLTYKELMDTGPSADLKTLPSRDIEIKYQDFFVDFTKTADAYQRLCDHLNLQANNDLLYQLIDRNKKNLQQLKSVNIS